MTTPEPAVTLPFPARAEWSADRDWLPPENSYGFRKRLEFCEQVFQQLSPRNVCDIGCGTGLHVTVPLARRFPRIEFTAVDSDRTSIEVAQQGNTQANLTFGLIEDIPAEVTFDLILISEVLEHVDDPIAFLDLFRRRLSEQGHILLTTPNGYGPFEWASLALNLAHLSGLLGVFNRLRGKQVQLRNTAADADSHAISPHVNFFSYGSFRQLATRAGFEIERYRPRTFLCGWLLDKLVGGGKRSKWNARIADRLPAVLNSGWMFVLRPIESCQDAPLPQYRRGAWARLRKDLNARMYRAA